MTYEDIIDEVAAAKCMDREEVERMHYRRLLDEWLKANGCDIPIAKVIKAMELVFDVRLI